MQYRKTSLRAVHCISIRTVQCSPLPSDWLVLEAGSLFPHTSTSGVAFSHHALNVGECSGQLFGAVDQVSCEPAYFPSSRTRAVAKHRRRLPEG
jgi:hypothetical protein